MEKKLPDPFLFKYPFKIDMSGPYEHHITYMTLNISYNNDRKVKIRKIHKDVETDELKKSKYKINDDEICLFDNQIDLDIFYHKEIEKKIFNSYKIKSIKELISYSLKNELDEFSIIRNYEPPKYGLAIYLGIKNHDQKLNDKLCEIVHQLCKKYIKTGVIFPSKEGIIYRINNCKHSIDDLKKFLEDFVLSTEKTILTEKKEEKKE